MQNSTSACVELSLRNHLCFHALLTEYGLAFHFGSIVRTMFASFFLFDAGLGNDELSLFTEVDLALGEAVLSSLHDKPWSLSESAIGPIKRLLALYDSQLRTAPISELAAAHKRAEGNFQAPAHERLSIAALVQRSKRKPQHSTRRGPCRDKLRAAMSDLETAKQGEM
jgi:hypothetical protein